MATYRHPDIIPGFGSPEFLDWLDSGIPLERLGIHNFPKRPQGTPEWILTKSGSVVPYATYSRAHYERDPIDFVTAEGWPCWYPPSKCDIEFVNSSSRPKSSVSHEDTKRAKKSRTGNDKSREYMDSGRRHQDQRELDCESQSLFAVRFRDTV